MTMDNQHKKIKGYRELDQDEIDLMNKIKEHGEQTKALLQEIMLSNHKRIEGDNVEADTYVNYNESIRCNDMAKDILQTGQMWLVRAVALPESF